MRKTYKIITASVVVASLLSGAMQMMNPDDRYNPNSTSYGRLLAEKYDQIASLEGSQGTYEHITFFKDKSNRAGNSYNPRPMTLKGLSNTHARSAELMEMRRVLDRAMVGYEMRYAPAEVAGMQASFEGRLKNIDINNRIDRECKQNFERFFAEAKRISDAQRSQEEYNASLIPQQMEQPNPNITYQQEPVVEPAPAPKSDFVPVPVDENLLRNKPKKPAVRQAVKPVPVRRAMPQKPVMVAPAPVKVAPVAPAPAPVFAPKPVPQAKPVVPAVPQKTTVKPNSGNPIATQDDKFDPLDYVHPRLREKMRQERARELNNSLPNPTKNPIDNNYKEKLPAPSIEGTITPPPTEPEEGFGIKPLSTAKPPVKPTAEAKFYNMTTNDIPAYTGGLPDAPVVKPNARFLEMAKLKTDKTATASVPMTNGEKFVVPFNQGGTVITADAQKSLDLIKSHIQSGQFSSVKIIGHSDSNGKKMINKAVSLNRASAIYKALGTTLSSARIGNTTIDGKGDEEPILSMSSADTRNRRVVVELIK